LLSVDIRGQSAPSALVDSYCLAPEVQHSFASGAGFAYGLMIAVGFGIVLPPSFIKGVLD
jgi:hypothetical protein